MEDKTCGINKENLIHILDRVIAQKETCEIKASIALSAIIVIIGLVLTSDCISKIVAIFNRAIDVKELIEILVVFINTISSICFVAVGAFFLIRVFVPVTKMSRFSDQETNINSLIFFSSIAKHKSAQEYKSNLMDCSEKDWIDEIISQIYMCSLVCERKFQEYKIGLALSVAGFATFFITIFWCMLP